MENQTVEVKFENQQKGNIPFDMINIENLMGKDAPSDHSPMMPHKVEFFIIMLITEGNTYHTIDFTDYKCTRGTLLTIRKDQIHKFFHATDVKGKLILFTNEFLIRYVEELENQKTLLLFNELLSTPSIQLSEPELSMITQLIARVEQEYFDDFDQHSLSIIRSELHILIQKLFRIKANATSINTDKKYLKEFIRLQELVEEKVSQTTKVKDYAQAMGVSTKTLNTITNNIVHKSAKKFIDEICITQIKRLLINTDLSIKEVAYATGFEETTNLYKYFKRHTTVTPEQFRKAY